jgi:DnaK suppressor protein
MKNKNSAVFRNAIGKAQTRGGPSKGGAAARVAASLKNSVAVKKGTPKINSLKRSDARNGGVTLTDLSNYRPSDQEPFMNDRQREYFRAKLLSWRDDILKEAKETLQHLQEQNQNHSDVADRATTETERTIELRARDRQRKLIAKIDAALKRIDDGTYGYCEETGEPIGLKRLEARPTATLSVEAQEQHERQERIYASS